MAAKVEFITTQSKQLHEFLENLEWNTDRSFIDFPVRQDDTGWIMFTSSQDFTALNSSAIELALRTKLGEITETMGTLGFFRLYLNKNLQSESDTSKHVINE